MAAALDQRGRAPSIPETLVASSDVSRSRPGPLQPLETLHQTDTFYRASISSSASSPLPSPLPNGPRPLPNSRPGRSQTLAHAQPRSGASLPIRRKPLASTASPLAARFSTRDYLGIIQPLEKPETRFSRSFSVDSPTLYEFPDQRGRGLSATSSSDLPENTNQDRNQQHTQSRSSPVRDQDTELEPTSRVESVQSRNIPHLDPPAGLQTSQTPPQHDSLTAHPNDQTPTVDTSPVNIAGQRQSTNNSPIVATNSSRISSMSLLVRKPGPPPLTLAPQQAVAGVQAAPVNQQLSAGSDHNLNKPLPRSPASSKFGTFFGWGTGTSPSVTEFSEDRIISPLPSPLSTQPTTIVAADASPLTAKEFPTSDTLTAESSLDYLGLLQTPPVGATATELDEMEDELKAISAELASSIRREIDLEDLVDRLQDQVNNPQPGRRTSDYFSDSGYSSAKLSDYDHPKEDVAQVQRRAEQEKAQIRLELTGKLQDERTQRKLLDRQIMELSQKAAQIDIAQMNSKDATGRLRELETTCDDLRRRLSEERQVKDNFEDLLSALKGELQSAANERDNLRDEIVPQLRARVEGLEAAAIETVQNSYAATKLQQELETLRMENSELKDARRESTPRIESTPRMSMGLSRSASVAGTVARKSRPTSLARSNTTKQVESRDALAERLKDVEAQRDALHSALKSLLDRQEHQNRENEKKIKVLELEKSRLLASSPKKAGYERELSNLREEISTLRRRAEDAIEQKFQVEKGLGGLKMDIDRAEAEILSLRGLLQEKETLLSDSDKRSSAGSVRDGSPVASASLEQAYKELQAVYADALVRIKNLELNSANDEKTQLAMERLERSLSQAVSERDMALADAESYRAQLESLQAAEKHHLAAEQDLASELNASAQRVEDLAAQVRSQLSANAMLRTRLTDTVATGEANQRSYKERIAGVQSRLRVLEEQLVAAQTAAEERVARHEEEVMQLKEAQSTQLQRLRPSSAGGLRSPRLFPPKSPLSPMLTANGMARSPRLSPLGSPRSERPMLRRASTASHDAEGLAEQVVNLKARVKELEDALTAADSEMEEVVGRMNSAQIEVLSLQEEKEQVERETRRLRRVIEEEKVRSFEERFRSITTVA